MKRFLKRVFITILIFTGIAFTAIALFLIIPTKTELNEKSLVNNESFTNYYDTHNKVFKQSYLNDYKVCETLSEQTKQAFIASEDKNFYSHHGLDYLRMAKAMLINIADHEFSQGASTISQQLIKNTQLSPEKTIARKLKEIKLTQKLEEKYSKEQILNFYVNTIYFGESNYGIENAADYYFDKSEKDLTLSELTLLVASIRSPSKINPVKNLQKLKVSQKSVLDRMVKCGFIGEAQAEQAFDEQVTVTAKKSHSSAFLDAVNDEIENKLGISPYLLKNCNVYTGYDGKLSEQIEETVKNYPHDRQIIVIDNSTMLIKAYFSSCGQVKRSPASTIKPIAVYAPAIEEKLISTYTVLDDNKKQFNGYSPSNYNDVYYGLVTAKQALKLSLNVPAVDVLNQLGAERALEYLSKMGIEENNKSLNLALGVTENGVTIKKLAESYAQFANSGVFETACFIDKITDENGNVIYQRNRDNKRIFSNSTASLINDCLVECSKSGTAKRLKNLGYDVATKTGTNGNKDGNLDAYSVSYTTKHTVASWIGNADGKLMNNDVTGGGYPTLMNLEILNELYNDQAPYNFDYQDTKTVKLDKYSLENNGKPLLADDNFPDKYVLQTRVSIHDENIKQSALFSSPTISEQSVTVHNDKITISYKKPSFIGVRIYKINENEKKLIYDGFDDNYNFTQNERTCEYSIVPYSCGKTGIVLGEELVLKKANVSIDDPIELKPDEWWSNENI